MGYIICIVIVSVTIVYGLSILLAYQNALLVAYRKLHPELPLAKLEDAVSFKHIVCKHIIYKQVVK